MTRAETLFLALQAIDTASEAIKGSVALPRPFRWTLTFRRARKRFRLTLAGAATVEAIDDDE